jgi:hypothetical protein
MQLAELSPDGSMQPLTALPGACRGRYLPGARVVLVGHDDGGNERGQLSLLRLPLTGGQPTLLADLEPLVHDPRFIHMVADLVPGRLCYLTNRRDGIRFDAVLRTWPPARSRPATPAREASTRRLSPRTAAGWR